MNPSHSHRKKKYYISHEYVGTIIHTVDGGCLNFVEYDDLGLSADIIKKIDQAETIYYRHLDHTDDRSEINANHQKQYGDLMADIIRYIAAKLDGRQDQLIYHTSVKNPQLGITCNKANSYLITVDDENKSVRAHAASLNIDFSDRPLLVGGCDGMRVRVMSSQCVSEDFEVDAFGSDVSVVFNFAENITKTSRRLRQKFPALSYVDYYGHTAFDGMSYAQLVEVEMPKLRDLATIHHEDKLAVLVNELLRFIEKDCQCCRHGDHQLLIFDGM